MLIDARRLTDGAVVDSAVCVIGGGVAGITLALELERSGVDVCLLESGGLQRDDATDALYDAASIGVRSFVGTDGRTRMLGGSSNCWGGWCRPLEPQDFATRAWLPHSGWPLTRTDLEAYYRRSHDLLDLGPHTFDADYWSAAIAAPGVRTMPLDTDVVQDSFSQFSGRHRLAARFHEHLAASPRVRVLLHANVTELETDEQARRVTGVRARTLSGVSFGVRADRFVLAAGGIENARLLLAGRRSRRPGLGDEHDLVGRYFMDHPRLITGSVRVAPGFRSNRLYDIRRQARTRAVSAHGTAVGANLVLAPDVVDREQLLNARVWFRSMFPGDDSPAIEAAKRLRQRVARRQPFGRDQRADLGQVLRDPWSPVAVAVSTAFPRPPVVRRVAMEIITEPEPLPESRVRLGDELDALGMPKVVVDWRVGERTVHTVRRTLDIVAGELARAGLAQVELPYLDDDEMRAQLVGTWHHMGTTRMDPSPREGVVDTDCRVHGTENLYVAGSSVFPTVGANFPTMTLTALSLRLADHLAVQHSSRSGRNLRVLR